MDILYLFVKGLILGASVIIGMIMIVLILVGIISAATKRKRYSAPKVLKAFQKYLKELHEDERFEEIQEVETIISELENGTIPKEVYDFEIKHKSKLVTKGNSFNIKKTIRVIGKRTEEE